MSQDDYFWPGSPQEGTFSALMGFCYCWLPSVWHSARPGVGNCLESCMKYNRTPAICWGTFLHNVYFEERGKKIYCPWQTTIKKKKKGSNLNLWPYASCYPLCLKTPCWYQRISHRSDKSLVIFISIFITDPGRHVKSPVSSRLRLFGKGGWGGGNLRE